MPLNSDISKPLRVLQTDWLNSNPVFYNTKTGQIGLNMNEVIDWNNLEFDAEGLYDYLCFGYQVFGLTPIKNVKFLRHSSCIEQVRDWNKKLRYIITEFGDPIETFVGRTSTVDDVIDGLREHIRSFEDRSRATSNKRFLLPLSGGYDSRLLAVMIEDKSRIDAFTYDISLSEVHSFEVKRASEVCRLLGINWKLLNLNKYWNKVYQDRNFDSFCLEMPIHAAYHMEMYDRIREQYGENYIVLSGSVGDWWSGEKVPLSIPGSHRGFGSLFFNHGISIPEQFIRIKTDHANKGEVFEKCIDRLKEDQLYRVVFARRGRMGLASYIFRTASSVFETYTPFYDLNIAMSQLNLPSKARKNREWQRDFFLKQGIGVELNHRLIGSNDCALDIKTAFRALKETDLLDVSVYEGIVDRGRVDWINAQLRKIGKIPFPALTLASRAFFGIDSMASQFGISPLWGRIFDCAYKPLFNVPRISKAISEWSVLKPLELCLRKAGAKKAAISS